VATAINISAYSDALVVLGTAGIVVPLVRRWGFSPVLGYLGAGALLGPLGLGSFIANVPALYWVTVVDAKNVAGIAELGVVFLLFLIGLELSYERLKAMRRLVFGLGSLQVIVTTAILAIGIAALGVGGPIAIMLGACLALSSTAIVLDVLSEQEKLPTSTGRLSFSILLAQDLAVIPLLMFISVLGADQSSSLIQTAALALLQAAAAVALIVIVGRTLLRPLFRLVASAQSSELFIAAILFVIVGTGVIAGLAGVSMALGAFVAGLLLAETEYRKAIEATIEPFKGLLLGIFFFTVGMSIDVRDIVREPVMLLSAVVGLIVLKAVIVIALARMYRQSWAASIESGLLLAPGGEFAFVAIGLALTYNLIEPSLGSFVLAVTSLTMALIPVLSMLAQRIIAVVVPSKMVDPILVAEPMPMVKHAIVIGYGRVGQVVTGLLEEHRVSFTAVDYDQHGVANARSNGKLVYFGDATNSAFLKACGVENASGVIITIHDQKLIDQIVILVRSMRPDIMIISRARDAAHARHLYALGVTDAVPETIEASLQLSEAALVGLGIPTGPVIASIHEHRDVFRFDLQKAAKAGGQSAQHSVRLKSKGKSSN
jgi:monovalent cation:H+ antiporter-2, CPA2 family